MKEEDVFVPKELDKSKLDADRRYDFVRLFKECNAEMALQQKKRDQIITMYLAIFSFLIPFALSAAQLSMRVKGLIFIAVGIIGVMFSFIVVRYRVYKEVYWLCCSTITCLMSFRQEEINKDLVQSVFHYTLKKKGDAYLDTYGEENNKKVKWNKWRYFKKNIFSAETLHYMIIDLLTSIFIALGVFLVCGFGLILNVVIAACVAAAAFIILLGVYFDKCDDVYNVLWSGKDSAFRRTFSKAWFLHLYIDEKAFAVAQTVASANGEIAENADNDD